MDPEESPGTRVFTQAEITHMVGVLRSTFRRLKQVAMRAPYKPSPRVDNHAFWEKVALNCLKNRANPEAFVEAAFAHSRQKHGPWPNQLCGPAAVAWYRQHVNTTGCGTPEDPSKYLDPEAEAPAMYVKRFRVMMEQALIYCAKVTGISDPKDPAFTAKMLETLTPCPVTIKTLFAMRYGTPAQQLEALEYYGEDAAQSLLESPCFAKVCEDHGYPTNRILRDGLKK
jgi:hypothetical protein